MKCFYLAIVLLLSQVVYGEEPIHAQDLNATVDDFDITDTYMAELNNFTVENPDLELQPPCKSKVYCNSELLHDVNMFCNHPNCSYLVSKKLRYNESYILSNYDQLKQNNNNNVSSEDLVKFISEHFEDTNEFEEWTPTDSIDFPPNLNRIKDRHYKDWALKLTSMWKTLSRKVIHNVKTHPDEYSMLWVPNGFIVPGGKFKEIYYWDTYWIINGLLSCGMIETARGMIENILSLVERLDFMPNGNRVFYLNRSQPPMLILMVLSYYESTGNFTFVEKNIKTLETEYRFWLKNRMVSFMKDGKQYKMARYNVRSSGPRPESYKADYTLAEKYHTQEEKNKLYVQIKSATESGWDFSSRWYITDNPDNDTDIGNSTLSDTNTTNIVPVDLNSLLHVNALTLSIWYERMGVKKKAINYKNVADRFLKNIEEVMWDPDIGVWFDWDLVNNRSRKIFFGSNFVPLWTESYTTPKDIVANKTINYLFLLQRQGSAGGTPASVRQTSQQWDLPNAWSPLQAFAIQGLQKTRQKNAQGEARIMAETWLRSNYIGFIKDNTMHEKYDVRTLGKSGVGGEYPPQTGFGWTNGVVLELLSQYTELIYSSNNPLT